MTYLDFDGTYREAVKGLRVVLNDFKKRGHGDAENIPNSAEFERFSVLALEGN